MTDVGKDSNFPTVDAAMSVWRQGDIAQTANFWHIADLRRPVTDASAELSEAEGKDGSTEIDTSVEGLVLLTQTCDIRRSSSKRPYVEVCPLVRVDSVMAKAVIAREIPRYAAIPALGDGAAADLDRVMTVEKGWLSYATRIPGWTTDSEIRLFQAAVARRYQRFAFPDDFNKSVGKLRKKIIDRHGKATSFEGQLFALVREIRVVAKPHWMAETIDVSLIFILPGDTLGPIPEELVDAPRLVDTLKWLSTKKRSSSEIAERILSESDATSVGTLWKRLAEAWAQNCEPGGCIAAIYGDAADASDYPVAEYWESDQLDVDYLSDDSSSYEEPPGVQALAESPEPLKFWKRILRALGFR